MSCVMCHLSPATCHLSHAYFFLNGQSGGASWWRVCYQRGLPRLVLVFTPSSVKFFSPSLILPPQVEIYKSIGPFLYRQKAKAFVSYSGVEWPLIRTQTRSPLYSLGPQALSLSAPLQSLHTTESAPYTVQLELFSPPLLFLPLTKHSFPEPTKHVAGGSCSHKDRAMGLDTTPQ